MGVQAVPAGIHGLLPEGTAGLLLGQSSTTLSGLQVFPGVIDSDYTGEIKIMLSSPRGVSVVSPGDKIAQILILSSHHGAFPTSQRTGKNNGVGSTGSGVFWENQQKIDPCLN